MFQLIDEKIYLEYSMLTKELSMRKVKKGKANIIFV